MSALDHADWSREILDALPDMLYVLDAELRFVFVNRAAEAAWGRSREELIGQVYTMAFPQARNTLSVAAHEEVQSARRPARYETHSPVLHRWIDVSITPTTDGGLVVQCRDIDERKRAADAAQERLERSRRELETRIAERVDELARANLLLEAEIMEREQAERDRNVLRRQLSSAEEEERRRLSRELHDQLGQHLTAITLGLHEVGMLVDEESPARSRLASLQHLTNLLTRDARYLAIELRPPELDDVGLESAVASYVDQWCARYGVHAEVQVAGVGGEVLHDGVASTLYRVLQEALTNVAKHAGASAVSVIMEHADGEVRLIVEDDGTGFDVDATMESAAAAHRLGLAGMEERVSLAGGRLHVESRPGGGTTIYARLPSNESRSGRSEARVTNF